jgi:hypothetical protein
MPSYQTSPLVEYEQDFQDIAADLFQRVPTRCGGKSEKGSYSFRMSNHSQETTAKIVIYERECGVAMRGELPWRNDGVYVLVRANGVSANALWNEITTRHRHFAARFLRSDDMAFSPNHDETFASFPVMAGESLDNIADFITSLMDYANA